MISRSLSPVAVLVLASLAEAPRHAYALKKDVRARSNGDVAPGVTTLYRAVWQLLDDGLIEESNERPAPHLDDQRRRYLRLTPSGRTALVAERRRLERLAAAARPTRLAPKPGR
jgi:DNA-binding PadR family transcriptional regulator